MGCVLNRKAYDSGVRYWLPALAAVICLVAASMVAPVIGFVLVIAAFGFILDVSTKLFESAGKTGGLGDHRQ
jgi:hypothetical protein